MIRMFWFLLYNPYLESSYSCHLPLVPKENTPNHNQSQLSSAHFINMPKHYNPNSENQENLLIKSTSNYNEENLNLLLNMKNGNKAAVMTPNGGAKNVLTNRKVLAEKTPGNGNLRKYKK